MTKKELFSVCNALQTATNMNSTKKPLILKRTWVVIYCTSACFIMFLLRYNLSVAIVAIKDEKMNCNDNHIVSIANVSSLENLATLIRSEKFQNSTNLDEHESVICHENKYKYDEVMFSQFLAAYFYGILMFDCFIFIFIFIQTGYAMFQLPVGRLSEKYGIAKEMIGYGVFLSGILSLLTPLMLDLGAVAFIITRFLIGSFHAAILTCCYCIIGDWWPKEKSGNAVVWAHAGYELGGCAAFYLTGLICKSDYLGWRYSFYLFAITSFVWFIPYYFMIHSRPHNDPHLSDYEKDLIRIEEKAKHLGNDNYTNLIKIPPKLNFAKILTSAPVIASCFAKCSYGLGYYIITTKIPTYLKELFDIPIDQNGLLSASPMLAIFISKMACLKLSTWVIRMNVMNLTNVRKLFQTISLFTPAFCLFLLTLKNDDKNVDMLLIFLAMLGQGMVCGGDSPISAEFGGDLSASIFGFTNTIACANGFLAPLMVGIILENFEDKFFAWNLIFYIAIVVYIIGGLVFAIFASAVTQEWAKSKYINPNEKSEI